MSSTEEMNRQRKETKLCSPWRMNLGTFRICVLDLQERRVNIGLEWENYSEFQSRGVCGRARAFLYILYAFCFLYFLWKWIEIIAEYTCFIGEISLSILYSGCLRLSDTSLCRRDRYKYFVHFICKKMPFYSTRKNMWIAPLSFLVMAPSFFCKANLFFWCTQCFFNAFFYIFHRLRMCLYVSFLP